jgi:Zn-dependent protease
MPQFLQNIPPELPFVLLLLALLGLRARVNPRASLFIAAPPEAVFAAVDLQDGQGQKWNPNVTAELIDPERRVFRMTWLTTLSAGERLTFKADFRVAEKRPPHFYDLRREGIAAGREKNELMRIAASFTPEGAGTRAAIAYEWGPRRLIDQMIARTDLWSSVWRLKSIVEQGKPSGLADTLISIGVAAATGLVTLVAFAWMLGPLIALFVLAALAVHEFGHLLAYKLIGQPWGRLIFLPFLGGLAVPRLPFQSQAQSVFAALMGPGFSVILLVAALYSGGLAGDVFAVLGLVAAVLNLFNLLPVEPLDGGVALRAIFAKVMGDRAYFGLMLVGIIIALVGVYVGQILLVIFGGLSILANWKPRQIDPGLAPLTSLQVAIAFFAYVIIVYAHATFLQLAQT